MTAGATLFRSVGPAGALDDPVGRSVSGRLRFGRADSAHAGDIIGSLQTLSGQPLGSGRHGRDGGRGAAHRREDLFDVLGERPELLRQMFAAMFRRAADPRSPPASSSPERRSRRSGVGSRPLHRGLNARSHPSNARGHRRGRPDARGRLSLAPRRRPRPASPRPEQFFGFRIGTDNKLARWDGSSSTCARWTRRAIGPLRELGKSTNDNPFVALEISAPDTLKNLDRYKQLRTKAVLPGRRADRRRARRDLRAAASSVVVVTCSIHATEIGATQMAVELVHRLATDNSPQVKKILDNVIFLLVPSLNPDGQIMVTDWFNKNLGTPFENEPASRISIIRTSATTTTVTCTCSRRRRASSRRSCSGTTGIPSVWLDEHQMGSNAARIFVMPATDPINPNVHPLIYRWNGILGQSQAAALEAAGKEGIIYNSTYTNFWQGAMAWSGWWHNQIGLLTEVASARVAAPIDQQRAVPGRAGHAGGRRRTRGRGEGRGGEARRGPLPAPTDINPRTEYPRPWMGGHWTLRDIVDYELIATMALLDTVADRRETLMRQIYEVNRQTIEAGGTASPAAIIIPVETQHDPHEAVHLVEKLQMAGVEVCRADAAVRGGRQDVRGGHVRHPDDAGVRALREGHPREADVPGGATRARRRPRTAVRRHARGRSACSSASITSLVEDAGCRDGAAREADGRAEARRARHRQRSRVRVRLPRTRRREGDQRAPQGQGARATIEPATDEGRARLR